MLRSRLRVPLLVALMVTSLPEPRGAAETRCPASTGRSAEELYEQGRQLWWERSAEALERARGCFEEALGVDPTFAPAWSGVADSWALLYDYPRAKEAALRAVELDDALAAAHASLGFVLLHGDWDWEAAGRELAQAVRLDPELIQARLWLAIYLEIHGRTNDSVAEAREAAQLEPASLIFRLNLGYRLFWARRYDEAAKLFRALLDDAPGMTQALYFLGRAQLENGDVAEALASLHRARQLSPWDANLDAALGYLYARAGVRDPARQSLDRLERLAEEGHPFSTQIAAIHAALGEEKKSFRWLERALEHREGPLAWLQVDPRFDVLRGRRRFEELLQEIGLKRAPQPLRPGLHH